MLEYALRAQHGVLERALGNSEVPSSGSWYVYPAGARAISSSYAYTDTGILIADRPWHVMVLLLLNLNTMPYGSEPCTLLMVNRG